jgi:phosphatidylinositol alpha-1,6-mannosyltransferase
VRHLLVTNDFPPKVGGIQSYLWELWRRLPADDVVVMTTPYADDRDWDKAQPFRVVRSEERVLLPGRTVAPRIDELADQVGADLVLLDPALPLGLVGPHLRHRYGVVLHGAEVTVPGRIPGLQHQLARVLDRAVLVVAAGGYPLAEAERAAGHELPAVVVPPGVDVDRFRPLDAAERHAARAELGLPRDAEVVLGLSRLVPRKGFDMLLRAGARLRKRRPDLVIAIGGGGRDLARLERIARESDAPASFLGRVPEELLPATHGSADLFAMLCRNRWGGLEQEGFGIVFVEAAACGVAQIAGSSGGAAEAVEDGVTGFVLRDPHDDVALEWLLDRLLDDRGRLVALGAAARLRAEREFSYEVLAKRLGAAIQAAV